MPRLRKLEYFEDQLIASPQGKVVLSVIHRHVDEVLYLVQKNRPTMVRWQRHHGPKFIRSIVDSGFDEDVSYEKDIEGVSLEMLVLSMAEVLQDNGTVELKRSIGKYAGYILQSIRKSSSLKEIIQSIHQYEMSH